MTTAGRTTFDSAKGGKGKNEGNLAVLSKQYSSRDMPGELKLKTRQEGQFTQEELLNKDFKKELYQNEATGTFKTPSFKPDLINESTSNFTYQTTDLNDNKSLSTSETSFKLPEALINLDKDDENDINNNSEFENDDDSDNSENDEETAELLAELQRIKKERAEANLRKEKEKQEKEEQIRMDNTKVGNPLLNIDSKNSFIVKRRWDDDVVFKNCNPGNDSNKKKTFINDTIRSEFHRKFMDKYVK